MFPVSLPKPMANGRKFPDHQAAFKRIRQIWSLVHSGSRVTALICTIFKEFPLCQSQSILPQCLQLQAALLWQLRQQSHQPPAHLFRAAAAADVQPSRRKSKRPRSLKLAAVQQHRVQPRRVAALRPLQHVRQKQDVAQPSAAPKHKIVKVRSSLGGVALAALPFLLW